MPRQLFLSTWFFTWAMVCLPAWPQSGQDLSAQWQAIESAIRKRRQQTFDRDQRRMWLHLANYLKTEVQEASLDARRKAVDLWSRVTEPACLPRLVYSSLSLQATRGSWKGWPALYRIWLLPLPGRVVLVGYPGGYLQAPTHLFNLHRWQAAAATNDTVAEKRVKETLSEEIRWRGPSRWALILVDVFSRPDSLQFPLLAEQDGRWTVRLEGRHFALDLPGRADLERLIGQPYDRNSSPPPGALKIYLAIDWSEYLDTPKMRDWLLEELLRLVPEVREPWFVDRSLFLHTRNTAYGIPFQSLRVNRQWPQHRPPGHRKDTVGAMANAIQAASRHDPVRLVFLTWNPGVSTPDSPTASWQILEEVLEGNPRVLAARLHLQVFQVHGKPVPWFAELAGEDGYNRPDYGGDYAPQLRWPVIER